MKHPAGDFYVIRNSYDRFGCQKVVHNLADVKLHKATFWHPNLYRNIRHIKI